MTGFHLLLVFPLVQSLVILRRVYDSAHPAGLSFVLHTIQSIYGLPSADPCVKRYTHALCICYYRREPVHCFCIPAPNPEAMAQSALNNESTFCPFFLHASSVETNSRSMFMMHLLLEGDACTVNFYCEKG